MSGGKAAGARSGNSLNGMNECPMLKKCFWSWAVNEVLQYLNKKPGKQKTDSRLPCPIIFLPDNHPGDDGDHK